MARDAILEISSHTKATTAMQVISDQESCANAIQTATREVANEFNICFVTTRSTEKIKELDWPKDRVAMTFRKNSVLLSKEEC